MKAVMRFKAEVSAGSQLPSVQVWSWWQSLPLRCLAYGRKSRLSSTSLGPSRWPDLKIQSWGRRGSWNQRAESPSTCREKSHWHQVLGAWGRQSLCVWKVGRREDREQTSVESFKSTLRAVRFLSIGDGQKREEGLWPKMWRACEEEFFFLMTGAGWREHSLFLAVCASRRGVGCGGHYDLSCGHGQHAMRTWAWEASPPPSDWVGLPFEHLEIFLFSSISFNN